MKNEYFGDARDYRKYGLLSRLSGGKKASAAVCWMLTSDVGRPTSIDYFRQPEKFRHFDPTLFDALQEAVDNGLSRDVAHAENPRILDPQVFSFYKDPLMDHVDQRRDYFKKFLSLAEGKDFIFFDPDNGLEIKGVPLGRKHSSKYLYLDELSMAFERQHSILVFQFYMKAKAGDVITQRTRQIFSCLDVKEIASLQYAKRNLLSYTSTESRRRNQRTHRTNRPCLAWKSIPRMAFTPRRRQTTTAPINVNRQIGDKNEKNPTIPRET